MLRPLQRAGYNSLMSMNREQIRDAALSLQPAEREALAEELLLSIDTADADAIDAAWLAEAKRRDDGTQAARPVEEVLNRLTHRTGL